MEPPGSSEAAGLIRVAVAAQPSDGTAGYTELAAQTGLAVSAVRAALKRSATARLIFFQTRRPVLLKAPLRELVLHGAKYAYAPVWGSLTRGVPTGCAVPPLNNVIAPSSDPVPVWPHVNGSVRRLSLAPLYPSVPGASLNDARLQEVLSLFDAIRGGQAREREATQKLLENYFR